METKQNFVEFGIDVATYDAARMSDPVVSQSASSPARIIPLSHMWDSNIQANAKLYG